MASLLCAAAAAINEGLVERDQPLHLIPASYALDSLIDLPRTKVLMKSGRQLSSVRNALINKNMISKWLQTVEWIIRKCIPVLKNFQSKVATIA